MLTGDVDFLKATTEGFMVANGHRWPIHWKPRRVTNRFALVECQVETDHEFNGETVEIAIVQRSFALQLHTRWLPKSRPTSISRSMHDAH